MTIFLETPRLLIKSPISTDLENWDAVHQESEYMVYSKETIKEWLEYHIKDFEKNGFSMGSVFLKSTNEFIGRAGIFYSYTPINDTEMVDIELGYIISKAHWGKGYATELATALIQWSFKNLNIKRLVALTRPDNIRSQRVLEKVGMHYVEKVNSEGEEFLLYEIFK